MLCCCTARSAHRGGICISFSPLRPTLPVSLPSPLFMYVCFLVWMARQSGRAWVGRRRKTVDLGGEKLMHICRQIGLEYRVF